MPHGQRRSTQAEAVPEGFFTTGAAGDEILNGMSDRGIGQPPNVIHHVVTLLFGALALGIASVLSHPVLSAISVGLGMAAGLEVAKFAWARHRQARRSVAGNKAGPGRIVEQGEPRGVSYELPADGLEPWAGDACVVVIVTLAAWALSAVIGRAVVFGFTALLVGAVAMRLWAVRYDRVRIELRDEGFLVESFEGGRRMRFASRGQLLPELQSDGLSLWSSAGRVGVLRGELQPEEREWLAERLMAFAERVNAGGRQDPGHLAHQGAADSRFSGVSP